MSICSISSQSQPLSQYQQKIKGYGSTCANCIAVAGGVLTTFATVLTESAKPLSDYYSCMHNVQRHKSECRADLTHELLLFLPASCLTACVCVGLTLSAYRVCLGVTNWMVKKHDEPRQTSLDCYGAIEI